MYSDLRRQLAEAERGFKAALSTTNQVGRALYTTALYDRISEPLTKLDASLARLQSGQGAGGRFLRDAAQYEQLRTSLASIRKTAADLRSGPFLGSDELYNDWNRRVNLMIRSVDEMNSGQWLLTSAFYDNLNGAAAEMQTTLKELRENPKKYLRLKVF
jgi:phospholipid/cholesterol/gamma-HCH transport system substrate-binding protein